MLFAIKLWFGPSRRLTPTLSLSDADIVGKLTKQGLDLLNGFIGCMVDGLLVSRATKQGSLPYPPSWNLGRLQICSIGQFTFVLHCGSTDSDSFVEHFQAVHQVRCFVSAARRLQGTLVLLPTNLVIFECSNVEIYLVTCSVSQVETIGDGTFLSMVVGVIFTFV